MMENQGNHNDTLAGIANDDTPDAILEPNTPHRRVVNVITGNVTLVALTPEEIATLPLPAPPRVPHEVSNFQARAMLKNMPGSGQGRTLFDDVDDALEAKGGIPWQAWEYATSFRRDSSLVAAIAAQLNLSDEQIDEMFIAAAAISL